MFESLRDDRQSYSFFRDLTNDTRLIPLYGIGISLLHLALHAIRAAKCRSAPKSASPPPTSEDNAGQHNFLQRLIQRAGGPTIFLHRLTRLLCSLILLALSLVTVFRYHHVSGTDSSWIHFVEPVVYVRGNYCLADDSG